MAVEGDAGDAATGEVVLSDRTWTFEAVPLPHEEEQEEVGLPFLEWHEITFRRADDPEQRAVARAGLPRGDRSEETLRSVLRSARTRTWRDPDGELWTVRLEGWSGSGISTDVADAEDGGRSVVFAPAPADGEGREVRRPAPDLASITAADDGELSALLEEGGGEAGDPPGESREPSGESGGPRGEPGEPSGEAGDPPGGSGDPPGGS